MVSRRGHRTSRAGVHGIGAPARGLVAAVAASMLPAALALGGCSALRGEDGTASDRGGEIVKIAVIAPESGDLSPLGLGIKNSVDLAIKQANASGTIPGWTLQLDFHDDQATPDIGKEVATQVAGDPAVVGVVGTLMPSVARSVQPVLASAGIVMVSPANTSPSLTRGDDFTTAPKRAYPNYFRTCTTDSAQGTIAARYLFEQVGVTQVATVSEKDPYGQALVEAFTQEYTKLGGTVVAAETVGLDGEGDAAALSSIRSSAPQAVYFGGEYPQAGPFSKQMKAAGLNVPLMGGDGIYTERYFELAGGSADGDLATSIGAPVASLDSAQPFIDAYRKAGYQAPYGTYGAYAYDAANAIINALRTSLPHADSVEAARQPTIDAMANVSFDGITGKVAFDQYGDTTTGLVAVYEVQNGEWTARDTFRGGSPAR